MMFGCAFMVIISIRSTESHSTMTPSTMFQGKTAKLKISSAPIVRAVDIDKFNWLSIFCQQQGYAWPYIFLHLLLVLKHGPTIPTPRRIIININVNRINCHDLDYRTTSCSSSLSIDYSNPIGDPLQTPTNCLYTCLPAALSRP